MKLPHLETQNNIRREIAAVYHEQLKNIDELLLPLQHEAAESVFHQFVVQLPQGSRARIREQLSQLGIGTLIHYPQAAHQMPAYRKQDWVGIDPKGLTATEALVHRILLLPMGPHLTLDQATKIGETLRCLLNS